MNAEGHPKSVRRRGHMPAVSSQNKLSRGGRARGDSPREHGPPSPPQDVPGHRAEQSPAAPADRGQSALGEDTEMRRTHDAACDHGSREATCPDVREGLAEAHVRELWRVGGAGCVSSASPCVPSPGRRIPGLRRHHCASGKPSTGRRGPSGDAGPLTFRPPS